MCWKCGKTTIITHLVSRADECDSCGADIRCCKNCTYYEPGSHYDCHETIDELVKDKESANFCGFFKLAPTISKDSFSKKPKPSRDAKNAFNSLFGD